MVISAKEYLKLIEEAQSSEDKYDEIDLNNSSYDLNFNPNDVSHSSEKELRDNLHLYTNLRIYNYLLIIKKYHGRTEENISLDLALWHIVNHTLSGIPCNMTIPCNLQKDHRFIDKPWISLFNQSGKAKCVPFETVIDIIKWIKIINKHPSLI